MYLFHVSFAGLGLGLEVDDLGLEHGVGTAVLNIQD